MNLEVAVRHYHCCKNAGSGLRKSRREYRCGDSISVETKAAFSPVSTAKMP
jgi:hypothetical protein